MPAPSHSWSKSSLGTLLEGCSWQWALEKVYRLPSTGSPQTALGTAYHAGVEWYLRRLLLAQRDGRKLDASFAQAFIYARGVLRAEMALLDDEQWALHGIEPADMVEQLEAALTHWWSTPIPDGQPGAGGSIRERIERWRLVALEPYFRESVTDEASRIHGFIDLVAWDPDEQCWVVGDHKSANTYGRWDLSGDGHEIEAACYVVGSEIARHLPAWGPVRMEWQIVRKKLSSHARFQGVRVVTFDVEDIHRLWLEDRLKLADRIVDTGAFETNPGWNLCSAKWCPYFRGCQIDGDLHPSGLVSAAPAGS